MSKIAGRPFSNTNLTRFLEKRILELKPKKSQRQIAGEAAFLSANLLSMIKTGTTRLPLDRVPALARSLECDPARLFILALEQQDNALAAVVREIFRIPVSANEAVWIEELRDASNNSDPTLTTKARRAIRTLFGK
ncbi:XRE family transcriptional regulator [Mesorhizobium sp. ASY16-5R]|uniref:XRE family transcriptional regulator n=1 Tax=Mesorhizobium sp. ASY16-5R TaxID=3445772 RepID=UPI003FA024B6